MKLFTIRKDGGKDSNVTGYWLIEIKSLFSIAILKFSKGSRDAYHSHAFNCISWVLSGHLFEDRIINNKHIYTNFKPSILPIYTTRDNLHKVHGVTDFTWVLTFRGPWVNNWNELLNNKYITLTHGRKVVNE